MKYVLAIALILAAAVGLAWQRATVVQRELANDVEAALVAADAESVLVSIEGLNVTLAGEVADSETKARIESAVALLVGAESLNNEVRVTAPEAEAASGESPGAAAVVAWEGCQAKVDAVLASGSIDFASSSAELAAASLPLLDRLAAVLLDCGETQVEVAGHTDASGPRDGNLQLSRERAEAVRAYLTNAGLDVDLLSAVGYGPDQPLVDNATPEGRARNRRIELKVVNP